MVKSGLSVRYKNGDKSNYVRRGPNYHIPLRNPCEQKNPTDCHFSPDYKAILLLIGICLEDAVGNLRS